MLVIEKYLFVDCFIQKFAKLFPDIPGYILFRNNYDIEYIITSQGKVKLDFTKCNVYFKNLLQFYDIAKIPISLKQVLTSYTTKNIILPCDSFFLEYSKQNYKKYHLEHNILLQHKVNDNLMYVYDDTPSYEGNLSIEEIKEAYKYFQYDIFMYSTDTDIGLKNGLDFFFKEPMAKDINCYDFLSKLLSLNCDSFTKLSMLEELRIPFKRFYSIVLMCRSLNSEYYHICDVCLDAASMYADELTLITNLASKALFAPDKYIGRIARRLENIKQYEVILNYELSEIKNRLLYKKGEKYDR